MKIGVFLPNWIGDAVMATPAIRALRNHFGPSAEMLGVARPYVAEVLAGTSWFDDWVYYQPRAKSADLTSRAAVRRYGD